MKKTLLKQAQLYAIVDTTYLSKRDTPSILSVTEQLIAGGVDLIQLRAKKESPEVMIALGKEILPLTRAAAIPLIINDQLEVAATLQADGLHLGQNDLSPTKARQHLGAKMIIGLSTHSLDQVQGAIEIADQIDYIGFGPLYPTPTKPDYRAIGLQEIATAHRLMAQSKQPLPIFCIGGVKLDRLPAIVAAGAQRVTVVSELLEANDPTSLARTYQEKLPPLS